MLQCWTCDSATLLQTAAREAIYRLQEVIQLLLYTLPIPLERQIKWDFQVENLYICGQHSGLLHQYMCSAA